MTVGILTTITLIVFGSSVPCQAQPPQDMVGVPAGEFDMGIKEKDIKTITRNIGGQKKELFSAVPQHKVNLKGYYIDKFEVSNKN